MGAGWESNVHDQCLYQLRGSDGNVAVLKTNVNKKLLTGDDEAEIRRMVEYPLGKYQGGDLDVPDKILGINIQVTERDTSSDQSIYNEGIVIEGMGSTDASKVRTPLYPGMDLLARRNVEKGLDVSHFPYLRIILRAQRYYSGP